MRITFLQTFRPKGQADDIPTYVAGETYAFDGPVAEGYAQKYLDRGLAEVAKPKAKAPEPVAPEPEPEIAPAADDPAPDAQDGLQSQPEKLQSKRGRK